MIRMHYTSRGKSRTSSTTAPRTSTSMTLVGDSTEWQEQARCRSTDPEIFHPSGRGSSSSPAKRICKGCPVIEACLQYALDNDERHGVWGGLDQRQRKALKAQPPKLTARERAAKIVEAGEKECPRCQVVKPLSEYARNSTRLDGRTSTCKKCRYDLVIRARVLRRHGLPATRAEHARNLPVRQDIRLVSSAA